MAFDNPPRGPVFREKSGSADFCDNYNSQILRYRESAREQARQMHRMNMEADQVHKYLRFLSGQQYPDRYRKWRSKFTDNRLQRVRYDHLALLTDTRPVIDVASSVEAYKPIADVLDKVMRYEWHHLDVDMKLVTAADIAYAYGTSFWRMGAASPGSMNIVPCGPDQVMPIQPTFSIQDATAVLYRTWKSVQWLKNKFPLTTDGIEREILNSALAANSSVSTLDAGYNRPSHIDELTWNGLAPAARRLVGKKGEPPGANNFGQYFKSIEAEELWVDDMTPNESAQTVVVRDPFIPLDSHNWHYKVKPGQRLWPYKRQIIFAGSRVLSDGPSPYWHGQYPFATLRFNPVFWSFWGLSKYRDLIPLNQAMNEIVAGCMDLIERALNPVALTKEGGVPPAAWKAFYPDLPGMKLRVGQNTSLNDALRYMDAPNIPQYVVNMLQGWLAPEFDRLSGSVDIQAMAKKKQVPGGDTLEQMRDSQQTGMRLEERMLEVFMRDAGNLAIPNILQFYSTDQRMRMLGADGVTMEDFNFSGKDLMPEGYKEDRRDFFKNISFNIVPGSSHGGAKDRTKQVAMALAARHQISLQEMWRRLEMGIDPKKMMTEMKEEAEIMGGGQKGGKGGGDRMTRGQRNGKQV
jgi:hypothetical protein